MDFGNAICAPASKSLPAGASSRKQEAAGFLCFDVLGAQMQSLFFLAILLGPLAMLVWYERKLKRWLHKGSKRHTKPPSGQGSGEHR